MRRLIIPSVLFVGLAGCATATEGSIDDPMLEPPSTSIRGSVPSTRAEQSPSRSVVAAVPTTPAPPVPSTTAPFGLPVPEPVPATPGQPGRQVGTIEWVRQGVVLPLYDGVNTATLDLGGAGLWPGTARPGQPGNVVAAAHRVSKGGPFRRIDQLVVGDTVLFNLDGQRHVYEVVETEVVTPDAMRIVAQTPQATATLFACHPPGSIKFRYVVKLALVE